MVKNNFKSILIHLSVSFICLLLFDVIEIELASVLSFSPKGHDIVRIIMAIVTLAAAVILYIVLARRYLEKLSASKNLLSVISVAIIGTILWCLGYVNYGDNFFKLYYQMYIAYVLPMFSLYSIRNFYLTGMFAIIPSLLMWMGVQYKRG